MREIRPIAGANVWHGRDMAGSPRWQRRLDAAQLAELDAALARAEARGLAWETMTADDFPLPGLAPLIADIRDELEDGSGLRSEEHTSELQSRGHLVCRLLLEKKKQK